MGGISMVQIRGGELVQKVLKKEGVKYIFGIPGGHIYPMMESCEENGIKFIGVRHEMTAAMMAEGWALALATLVYVLLLQVRCDQPGDWYSQCRP